MVKYVLLAVKEGPIFRIYDQIYRVKSQIITIKIRLLQWNKGLICRIKSIIFTNQIRPNFYAKIGLIFTIISQIFKVNGLIFLVKSLFTTVKRLTFRVNGLSFRVKILKLSKKDILFRLNDLIKIICFEPKNWS